MDLAKKIQIIGRFDTPIHPPPIGSPHNVMDLLKYLSEEYICVFLKEQL